MIQAIYPGSFDPVTFGHIEIMEKAIQMFGNLTVVVAENPAKKTSYRFIQQTRIEQIKRAVNYSYEDKFSVTSYDGLVANWADEPFVIVKGIRFISDFDSELQQALANLEINRNAQTIWIPTSAKYMALSSSLVKEVAAHGGDVSKWVPWYVVEDLQRAYELGPFKRR